MTLATSSSIYQAKRFSDDRQADIRRDAERTRIAVPKATAPSDVLPDGVDDLTPALVQRTAGRIEERPRGLIDGIVSRLVPTRPARA
jgi:hypothetical protein